MTIRTFWNILLKVLGIWVVLGSLPLLPNFLFSMGFGAYGMYDPNYFQIFFFALLTLGLFLLIIRTFVLRTSWLIDRLKLDKGFDEETIQVNMSYSTLLRIAVIVTGGVWLVQNLLEFVREMVTFIQDVAVVKDSQSTPWLIFYAASAIVGYLLLTNSKSIVRFILKQTEADAEDK
jgi:hypothetical protein